jgi:ribA/ribD-fused uncharacterized protein
MEDINFYRVSEEYGCFSNFAPYPVRLDGKVWPTSEHYFQAQKFNDVEHQERIRQANSPMTAAHMGRDRKMPIRPDWESVKILIMHKVVRANSSSTKTSAILCSQPAMRRSSSTPRMIRFGVTVVTEVAKTC